MDEKKPHLGTGWFLGVLALVFITLKINNIITWPWFWVLVPLWGTLVFSLVCACILNILLLLEGD